MKKFDQVNPIIGKLAAQVRASKLTEKELKMLDNFEADQIQARLDRLKYGPNNDDGDDNDNKKGPGGTPGGTPLADDSLADDDELLRRPNRLRGNDTGELVKRFNRLCGNESLSPRDVERI